MSVDFKDPESVFGFFVATATITAAACALMMAAATAWKLSKLPPDPSSSPPAAVATSPAK